MQALQAKAGELSGVSNAFAIDEVNIFEKVGLDGLKKLSTRFYTKVYNDEDEAFRQIFIKSGSKMEDAIQNQYEFFAQRFGGPPLFSQRKGHPALIGRHVNFEMELKDAERWIMHMQAAMDETPLDEIDADCRERIMSFLKHTAYFIVLGVNGHTARSYKTSAAGGEAAK